MGLWRIFREDLASGENWKQLKSVGTDICSLCVSVLGDNSLAKPWVEAYKKDQEKAKTKKADKEEETYKSTTLATQQAILETQQKILEALERSRS